MEIGSHHRSEKHFINHFWWKFELLKYEVAHFYRPGSNYGSYTTGSQGVVAIFTGSGVVDGQDSDWWFFVQFLIFVLHFPFLFFSHFFIFFIIFQIFVVVAIFTGSGLVAKIVIGDFFTIFNYFSIFLFYHFFVVVASSVQDSDGWSYWFVILFKITL